jgi:hypothetical protein
MRPAFFVSSGMMQRLTPEALVRIKRKSRVTA